jgi:hypothetical protein
MTTASRRPVISRTGRAYGWGSAKRKGVTHLSAEERATVWAGGSVLIGGCPPAGGNHGTTWRRVEFVGGRYQHRVPLGMELAWLERSSGTSDDPSPAADNAAARDRSTAVRPDCDPSTVHVTRPRPFDDSAALDPLARETHGIEATAGPVVVPASTAAL